MRKLLLLLLALSLFLPSRAFSAADEQTKNTVPASNASFVTDLQNFLKQEDAERYADMFSGFVVGGGTHGTPAGLTGTPSALTAYPGGFLVTETGSITYSDSETTWVIAHKNTTGNVGTFTRVSGTHYLTDNVSASKPTLPADSVWLMDVTTSGGSITTVTDLRSLTPVAEVFLLAELPAAGTRGRIAFVRDKNQMYFDNGSAWSAIAPTWNEIPDPTGAQALTMGANNSVWTWDNASGKFSSLHTSNFTLNSTQFLIQQQTGNPASSVLFSVAADDADVIIARFADASANGVQVSQAGALVSIGTGTIAANRTICTGTDLLQFDGTCAAPTVGVGTFGSRGQLSLNNSVTPNTQYDLDADVVVLRNTSEAIVVRHNPGAAITNNILTAGVTANGRDQAGAFSASSWVHFYWIWNGSTLATVSSAVAPPTGPTFPSGYTHWSYAGAVRMDASSFLVKTVIHGDEAYYQAGISVVTLTLSGTSESTVDVSAEIPPNALAMTLAGKFNAANATQILNLRFITTLDFLTFKSLGATANVLGVFHVEVPNIGQQFFYQTVVSDDLLIDVVSYTLPNGGS